MSLVRREQLVDHVTWGERRDRELPTILAVKAARRVHVGPHLTFLFENADTVRWQVQEMMRVERIVREADILHELHTYNELLGAPGELGCTLLVEIEDPQERAAKLAAWLDLPRSLYAELADGTRIRPAVDARQVGEDRLSSVQYLKFPVAGQVPVALGADHAAHQVHAALSTEQRAALALDLSVVGLRPAAL
ncbi:MAG: DUF3501 family protein [Myxococcota bacterium]